MLEALEARLAPATLVVTSTLDDGGSNSLRYAVAHANPGDTIDFNIDTSGQAIIHLQSPLPVSTPRLTIDGTSQPGFSSSPLIVLDGTDSPMGGLQISANHCLVNSLAFVNFASGPALEITGPNASSNTIFSSYFGTTDGTTAAANQIGVEIDNGASNNRLGGSSPNVLSGNSDMGVWITGSGTSGNEIANAYIGTDMSGTTRLPNSIGVQIDGGASGNTVGQPDTVTVISGNIHWGVWISGPGTTNNLVQNAYIGPDASGEVALANSIGVLIDGGASGNAVGNPETINVISGNAGPGVWITGAQTTANVVDGNLIGTDTNGDQPLGNHVGVQIDAGAFANQVIDYNNIEASTFTGVLIAGTGTTGNILQNNNIGVSLYSDTALPNAVGVEIESGASGNTVGGPYAGNVISGNNGQGLWITCSGTSNNLVLGNFVGTDTNGQQAVPNPDGVQIDGGASGNTVGDSVPGDANIISGNTYVGVWISGSGTSGNVVQSNYVGTDVTGTTALPNLLGVLVNAGATGNTIGNQGAGNVISGNTAVGIAISDQGTTGNQVLANFIGTTADGTAALPNQTGIQLSADQNTIGGFSQVDGSGRLTGLGNLISGNTNSGIAIISSSDVVQGNAIGTDITGLHALPNDTAHGFACAGIELTSASGNVIGGYGFVDAQGHLAGTGNLVSGNGGDGIAFLSFSADAPSNNNVVEGNAIGTDITGAAALTNQGSGIVLQGNAAGNTIGGVWDQGTGNLISGNVDAGVRMDGTYGPVTNNTVVGNRIGTNVSGTYYVYNVFFQQQGILIQAGASNNVVGGTTAGAGNLISANYSGVELTDSRTSGNRLLANRIGVTADGNYHLPNGYGVYIHNGASDNVVGGDGLGNQISGNTSGVYLQDRGTSGNLVLGNLIGTTQDGMAALPNAGDGIQIDQAQHNTIGGFSEVATTGLLSGLGNLISGNGGDGCDIFGGAGNVIQGNAIGTDRTGLHALPNYFNGIFLGPDATSNTIGGVEALDARGNLAGLGNLLSGNSYFGLVLVGSDGHTVANNLIEGNAIGTDITGTAALPNVNGGIFLDGPVSGNTIGGSWSAGTGNLISGNGIVKSPAEPGIWMTTEFLAGPVTANVVTGNRIGTDVSGTRSLGNQAQGIVLQGDVTNNVIGGSTAGAGNLISGNGDSGIDIAGSGAAGNLVEGNFIGTDAGGTVVLSNQGSGVLIVSGASGNTIGGTSSVDPTTGKLSGAGNLISGNEGSGVQINNATGNVLEGNFIGTDATGEAALGNGLAGLFDNVDLLNGASNNTIGGQSSLDAAGKLSGLGNLISGDSMGTGLWITNALSDFATPGLPSSNNLVQGNFIGTDVTGNIALAGANAIVLNAVGTAASTVANNTIGGLTPGTGNVLNGNMYQGIRYPGLLIGGAGASDNLAEGNHIGTNAAGTVAFATASNGVVLSRGANNNTIGGTAPGAGNLISGNTGNGVWITGSGTTANLVQGNFIGTTADGSQALGNGGDGVQIAGGASNNTIGGASQVNANGQLAGAGNLVSGNETGVFITDSGTNNNLVQGNYIGTDRTGTRALGNRASGVILDNGASRTHVGGLNSVDRHGFLNGVGNLISGNTDNGVLLIAPPGLDSPFNLVQGNFIGTDIKGAHALGNGTSGVAIVHVSSADIGGTGLGAGNLISGNHGDGVLVLFSTHCGFLRNRIGTMADGRTPLGNGGNGITLGYQSSDNRIGLVERGLPIGNTIAFNDGAGIVVGLSPTDLCERNFIICDSIFGNGALGIDLGNDGVTLNTAGGPHSGPNNFQNYPILDPLTTAGIVTGSFNSTPNTVFEIQLFAGAALGPTGYGQGETFLGFYTVGTDGQGNAHFTLHYVPVAGQSALTATAIGAGGTSEFSPGADFPLIAAAGTQSAATEGVPTGALVATFADSDPNATAGDYAVVIQWGDGTSSAGTAVQGLNSAWSVAGSHTYAEEAALLPVTVQITDVASGQMIIAHSLMTVADGPLTLGTAQIACREGTSFSGIVLSFLDPGSDGTTADYAATVVWGDGTATVGTLAALGLNAFAVSGSHTYAEEGTYPLLVRVADQGGSSTIVQGTAVVTDAALAARHRKLIVTGNKSFSGVVATFTDADPAGTPSDFRAIITWDDGSQSSGTITGTGAPFKVRATHEFASFTGTHTITITITDAGGATATVTDKVVDPPAPTPNQPYVAHLYLDLLGRSVEDAALSAWGGALDSGAMSRAEVAEAIVHSAEYRTDQVQALYQHYLRRAADPQGLAAFVHFLEAGGTVEQAAAAIVTSPEYRQAQGSGSTSGWLEALYADVLNRVPDADGLAAWQNALAQGMSMAQAAQAFFLSHEYERDLFGGYYEHYLNRGSDQAGMNVFSMAMSRGVRDEDVVAALVASDEYFANVS
jgi:parallel beta-helix repeat protein